MSNKDIKKRHHQTFEQIKEQVGEGKEFWTARKLSKVLDYSEYGMVQNRRNLATGDR